jgi:hypothetical protein
LGVNPSLITGFPRDAAHNPGTLFVRHLEQIDLSHCASNTQQRVNPAETIKRRL